MKPRSLIVFAFATLLPVWLASIAGAQVPDAIAAPTEAPMLTVHAEGAQIYECKTDSGGKLVWTNCGLCVDERGVGEVGPGVGRGSPADFWKAAEAADNTLVIPTKG